MQNARGRHVRQRVRAWRPGLRPMPPVRVRRTPPGVGEFTQGGVAMAGTGDRTVTDIFAAPSRAFAALRDRPTFALPLLAVLLANTAVVLWYYHAVDIVWLIDSGLERAGTDMPPEQRARMLEGIAAAPRAAIGAAAAAASGGLLLLLMLLWAGYLSLVSMATNDGFGFRRWFSLVCWSALPLLLASLASMVNLAASDPSHLPAERLNPLSLASLAGSDLGGRRSLQMLDVTTLWAMALLVLGHAQWTGRTLGRSALTVLAPVLVIAATLLLLALRQGGA